MDSLAPVLKSVPAGDHFQMLAHRKFVEECAIGDLDGDGTAKMRRAFIHGKALERDAAFKWNEMPQDCADQCRLSAAIGSDNSHASARRQPQVDWPADYPAGIADSQASGFQLECAVLTCLHILDSNVRIQLWASPSRMMPTG